MTRVRTPTFTTYLYSEPGKKGTKPHKNWRICGFLQVFFVSLSILIASFVENKGKKVGWTANSLALPTLLV